jgi:hypothetical protein
MRPQLTKLQATTVEILKSDDTKLTDIVYKFTADNMQAKHSDAARSVVQKVTLDILAFDSLQSAELRQELTYGHLIDARYLAEGKVFIINAPDPLALAIIELFESFTFSTGQVKYTLTRDPNFDLSKIGSNLRSQSSIEWLEITIPPGTDGTPADHKTDITRALKDVGILPHKIALIRKGNIKYNVQFTTEPTFHASQVKNIRQMQVGQGKHVRVFLSPRWREFLDLYECCLERNCFCSGNRRRNNSSTDRKSGEKRKAEMDQQRFKRFNSNGAGPSS